ncbi:copper-binding protein [Salmonella enterica]|nr:copper-binding protein [Salmonella enterica subsp. enterica serovar Sundsvall]EAM7382815.1 copper-binding protein [Salmonella enterica]ECD4833534.1 copper-binding protein [Salmonella enterica subsp. enterica serovar Sundsvall]ECJ9934156.1 copper-binding protein [Salmonella enterica]ECQ0196069.1 copper-binding protein [Salmonella enterica]
MKKIIIATAISLGIASSAWAAQTAMPEMDMSQHQQAVIAHDTMKNGNSNAHQQMADAHKKMMGTQAPTETVNTAKSFSSMNEHEQAMIVHENMNNGHSYAHEQMVENHKKMMSTTQMPSETETTAKSFSSMNEHEQAAVVHEFTKNGQSAVHQQEAEQHLVMQNN